VSVSLSTANPLDALLLPVVLRWVAVVFRQKSKCGHLDKTDGRPWTRLPARDLAAQLEREHGLQVGVRRVQRSLCRLVEEGHLARQQRTKWWGQRDYWYTWSDDEWALQQHRPTAVARGVSGQPVRNRPYEATVPSRQVLSTPLTTRTSLETEPPRATASQDGVGDCGSPQVPSAGSQAQPPRRRGTGALQTLFRTVKRAEARGFAPTAGGLGGQCPPLDQGSQHAEATWVEGKFRYTRLESGHVVKDDLATAPLR
jgi:hypothetical protein